MDLDEDTFAFDCLTKLVNGKGLEKLLSGKRDDVMPVKSGRTAADIRNAEFGASRYAVPQKAVFSARKHTYVSVEQKESVVEIVYELFDTLMLFKNDKVENYLEKIVNFLVPILRQEMLEKLLRELKAKFSYFKKSKSIVKLFKICMNWLEKKVESADKFSWVMDGSIAEHPKFEKFLKSEDESMAYAGSIVGVVAARKFIQLFSGLRSTYSVTMDVSGTGAKCVVHIRKTRELHESRLGAIKPFQSELDNLKTLLK
jgi:hypothetical protein